MSRLRHQALVRSPGLWEGLSSCHCRGFTASYALGPVDIALMLRSSRCHSQEGLRLEAAERVLNGKSTNRVYITCAKLAKHNCRTIVKRCSIKSEVMQSALSHCWENVNYCSRDRSVALLRGDGCLEMYVCGGAKSQVRFSR